MIWQNGLWQNLGQVLVSFPSLSQSVACKWVWCLLCHEQLVFSWWWVHKYCPLCVFVCHVDCHGTKCITHCDPFLCHVHSFWPVSKAFSLIVICFCEIFGSPGSMSPVYTWFMSSVTSMTSPWLTVSLTPLTRIVARSKALPELDAVVSKFVILQRKCCANATLDATSVLENFYHHFCCTVFQKVNMCLGKYDFLKI